MQEGEKIASGRDEQDWTHDVSRRNHVLCMPLTIQKYSVHNDNRETVRFLRSYRHDGLDAAPMT